MYAIRSYYDTEQALVHTKNQSIRYDHLIIGTGSRTYFPDFITGLREHTHGVKSIPAALDFKQQFERSLLNRIEAQSRGCRITSYNVCYTKLLRLGHVPDLVAVEVHDIAVVGSHGLASWRAGSIV